MSEQVVLNPQQSAAVTASGGPILVLAGAGTGKTRVIVERIVWLIQERGVDPRNIMAVTFTNRAANEMKQRAASRLGFDRLATFVGTSIHLA
jgi:DNA helicase-2/ATP-dependent DNA helicase PcrA